MRDIDLLIEQIQDVQKFGNEVAGILDEIGTRSGLEETKEGVANLAVLIRTRNRTMNQLLGGLAASNRDIEQWNLRISELK